MAMSNGSHCHGGVVADTRAICGVGPSHVKWESLQILTDDVVKEQLDNGKTTHAMIVLVMWLGNRGAAAEESPIIEFVCDKWNYAYRVLNILPSVGHQQIARIGKEFYLLSGYQ